MVLKAGEAASAHVYGIVHYEAVGNPLQQRKYLVLREQGTGIFFIGAFKEWRRMQATGRGKFDVDDNSLVLCLSDHELVEMEREFARSTELCAVTEWTNVHSANTYVENNGPPAIKAAGRGEEGFRQAATART